jgi:hypothetical protein
MHLFGCCLTFCLTLLNLSFFPFCSNRGLPSIFKRGIVIWTHEDAGAATSFFLTCPQSLFATPTIFVVPG